MFRIMQHDAICIPDNAVSDHGYTQVPDYDGKKKYPHTKNIFLSDFDKIFYEGP